MIGLAGCSASDSQSEPASVSVTAQPPALPQRMRGINISPVTLGEPGFVDMVAGWGVNVLRLGINTPHGQKDVPPPTADNPLAPYETGLKMLDAALPKLRAANIKLIIVGDAYGRNLDVMWRKTDQAQAIRDHLANFWEAFAKRYKDEPAIVAYDVFNEPNYPAGQAWTWYDDMLPKAVAAIRKVNPTIWLVVEPGPWGLPGGFADLKPIDDPYVIYSFHHYAPHRYCHQGILHYKDVWGKLTYPGMNSMFGDTPEKYWDKKAMEDSMQAVIDFQAKYPHARIYVGEFGVLRWAPGRAQWLADSIDIFEKHGWDWTFHSVGSWNGWDPTFAADAPASNDFNGGQMTERLKVLIKGWSANRTETSASR
ncbi:MAG: glycoside hydrolase family 5 protein [Phycisphaerales bacterium]